MMQANLASLKAQAKIEHITADSRQVQAGALFVAYQGETADGRAYIDQAIEKGAVAVIWDDADFIWQPGWKVPNQALSNLKQHVGKVASEFYGAPSKNLWMIGVTGTNGKTTCTHWLAQAFAAVNRQSAVIGTLGNGVLSNLSKTMNTTPDAIVLHELLASYVANKIEVVAMEVSSHGLDQGRVNGVAFDVAVFTNLTRDHLDYHGSMQAYGEAKRKLFELTGLKAAVLNRDDVYGAKLASELIQKGQSVFTYGINKNFSGVNDIAVKNMQLNESGITIEVMTPIGEATVHANVIGQFNVYNLLAVLATLLASDISLSDAVHALSMIKPVPGRMQQLGGGEYPLIVIDYAHTPDALEQALNALRSQLSTNSEIYCVFGCGGDRDKGKRPLMGQIASSLANHIVVTSDNPRTESPQSIIQAVMTGVNYQAVSVEDRAEAIRYAVKKAKRGDLVLIAGKGHEEYQEIAGVKYPFSDMKVAEEALQEKAA